MGSFNSGGMHSGLLSTAVWWPQLLSKKSMRPSPLSSFHSLLATTSFNHRMLDPRFINIMRLATMQSINIINVHRKVRWRYIPCGFSIRTNGQQCLLLSLCWSRIDVALIRINRKYYGIHKKIHKCIPCQNSYPLHYPRTIRPYTGFYKLYMSFK